MLIKNTIELWSDALPRPAKSDNKYDRGHLIILGGENMTGAARLASEAAMHAGCGLCTIVSSEKTRNIYLSGAPHIMFESYDSLNSFPSHLTDKRRTAAVMGCGAGKHNAEKLRQAVLGVLKLKKPVVLDADALTVFEGITENLFPALHEDCILTPHEGEFARLFPNLSGSKEDRARQAAKIAGAIILLKGTDTIICSPEGKAIQNDHATSWLATAGSGDVLAGIIGGFLAQDMDSLKASAAATWIHGESAIKFGPGLTAPDIINGIPTVLKNLYS